MSHNRAIKVFIENTFQCVAYSLLSIEFDTANSVLHGAASETSCINASDLQTASDFQHGKLLKVIKGDISILAIM